MCFGSIPLESTKNPPWFLQKKSPSFKWGNSWLVVWLPFCIFPYIGNNHPNWLNSHRKNPQGLVPPHFSRHRWMAPLRTDARVGMRRGGWDRQWSFVTQFSVGKKWSSCQDMSSLVGFLFLLFQFWMLGWLTCWYPPLISCSLHCTDITPLSEGDEAGSDWTNETWGVNQRKWDSFSQWDLISPTKHRDSTSKIGNIFMVDHGGRSHKWLQFTEKYCTPYIPQ